MTADVVKEGPSNSLVGALLTDMYQISMSYAYWKQNRADSHAVFDLFFRKAPFGGEFCIFAGLDEVLRYVSTFRFHKDDVEYLRELMPDAEEGFFEWLLSLDCSKCRIYAQEEGSIVFPKEPLLKVEGPLALCQLLETALLNLINFPSLVATNAARMRLACNNAGKTNCTLLEFGLRRAQGPDGGFSASKYSYLGGFDGTSNVLAGKLTGINVKGTHAHSFVMSYSSLIDLQTRDIVDKDGNSSPFVDNVFEALKKLGFAQTHEGEMAAFIAYAQSFPKGVLCLVDTYDTIKSGIPNFMAIALALHEIGYKAIGIRLDSGDLAYLSKVVRGMFRAADKKLGIDVFSKMMIVASNDINEDVLNELGRQGHEIDCFGIGTHLVTCQAQPALGCVYKLVEIEGKPRIKLSQEREKLVIPCSKLVYRFFGKDGYPLIDVIQRATEPAPQIGDRVLCRHPFQENQRAHVTPTHVKALLALIWDGENGMTRDFKSLNATRAFCHEQLGYMREDHVRTMNPTPYKMAVSASLYDYMHELWMKEAPIADLE
jgi:nicotinate phosphoribosyltransferase